VRRVLVTGAAGNIGTAWTAHARTAGRYELRLTDVRADPSTGITPADLADLGALKSLCEGIDTVVHLAGDPDPSGTWASVHRANIEGTYNVFVAAKAAGCRRVVYASSIHAVSGYSADVQVKTSEPVNPGDVYGVTKCFGEALGRYMAEQEGLSVIAIRIGAFDNPDQADAFISRRDMCQLIDRCIEADGMAFAVVHGLSENRYKRLDLTDTRRLLGYAPQDDAAADVTALADQPALHNLSSPLQQSGLRDDL